jgi:alpha-L-arabinofuranosidase
MNRNPVVARLFLGISILAGMLQIKIPRTPATSDLFIYMDGLGSGWANWSWDATSLDLFSTVEVYSGTHAIAVDLGAWGGLSFRHTDFCTEPWEALEFYIYGGIDGAQQLRVFLHGAGGGQTGTELPPVSLNDPAYIQDGTVSAGIWKQGRIPLPDLNGADTVISRVNIQAVDDQPLFHIDAVRLVAPTDTAQPLHIAVNAADIRGPIPQTILGTNAAMWDGNLHENIDVIHKVQASEVTVIRFPGGSTSDECHWQDYEPETSSNAWSTNTSEFIQFVRAVGAEPMFTANFGTGTAQEAADWVHLTNVEHDWNVKYWEVGNEIYGAWETSWTHDATEYVHGNATHDGFNAFCQAMKTVDPTILVGAVGTAYPDEYDGWGPTVLQLAGDCMDFYAIHRYPLGPGNLDYQGLIMDPPTAWSSIGNSVRQMIADNAPGQEIQIAITEYNSYYTEPEELAIQTVNMLFLADTLGQLIDQGFVFANHWDILNNLTANGGDYGYLLKESANYRQPSYYVFPLWSRAGDQRIASTVNRDAGTEMTVYASRHSASGDVNLVVINKTGEDQTGTIEIDEFNAAGTIEAYTAQGDSLDDPSVTYTFVSAKLSAATGRRTPIRTLQKR